MNKIFKILIAVLTVVSLTALLGCGGPKYPKADFEVTTKGINNYLIERIRTKYNNPHAVQKLNHTLNMGEDNRGKVIRIKGPASYLYDANNKKLKNMLHLGKIVAELDTGDKFHLATGVIFKEDLPSKIENMDNLVIQGVIAGEQMGRSTFDYLYIFTIADAVIIKDGEFNKDNKANVLTDKYIKDLKDFNK